MIFCIDKCEPRFIADVLNADIVILNVSMMIWMKCGQHHGKHRIMSSIFHYSKGYNENRSGLRC